MSEQVISPAYGSIAKLGDCYKNPSGDGYRLIFEGIATPNYHVFYNYNLFPDVLRSYAGTSTTTRDYSSNSGTVYSYYYYRFVACVFGEHIFGASAFNSYSSIIGDHEYPSLERVRPTHSADSFYPTTAYTSRLELAGITAGNTLHARINRSVKQSLRFSVVTGDSLTLSLTSGTVNREVTAEAYNDAGCMHLGGEGDGTNLVYFVNIGDPNLYRVKHWLINGSVVSNSAGKTEIGPSLPYADAVITCVIEQYKWSFTAKSNSNASVGVISGAATNVYTEKGTNLPLEAICQDTANYRFIGWYRGYGVNLDADACIERISTDSYFTYVMDEADVTIVGKFASRKTILEVGITGSGTFDLTINKTPMGVGLTTYLNNDARDGWEVLVTAHPSERYFLSHWLIPNGETTTTNVYNETASLILPTRAENKLVATFIEKTVVPITGSVVSEGYVTYSGDLSAGGSFNSSATHVTTDTYIETAYAFVAKPNNKLYAFDKWQYLVGETWMNMDSTTFPSNWIQSIDGNTALVYVKNGTANETHHIRAVFRKIPTYTISEITVEGSHPINGTLASQGGCSYTGLPAADEVVSGANRWLEGTVINLIPVTGAKWIYDSARVVMTVDGQTTISNNLKFTLNGNVTEIQIIFTARKYSIKTLVAKDSEAVGQATFTYLREDSETPVEVDEADDVYVDTDITIYAKNKSGYSDADVGFYDWSLNGVQMPYLATQKIYTIQSDMTFTAQFAVRHTFQYEGTTYINEIPYDYGKIDVAYENNGVEGYPLELPKEGRTVSLMLRCGSPFSLLATPLMIDTGTTQLKGFFIGWQESIGGVWTPVGWTEEAEVVAKLPRTIKGIFDDTEVWPILRLRNFAETLNHCTFSVSGTLPDRQQVIDDDNTIVLTDKFDFFCKPFSTIRVSVIKTNESFRFERWRRYSLELNDVSAEVEIDSEFSTDQDLTFVITGDTSLRPEFYTGIPTLVGVHLVNGSESFGKVAIEGEYLEETDFGKTFVQDDVITLVATPNNGYKFVGWYSDFEGTNLVSDISSHAITVGPTESHYYAKFEQDKNAIYRFGEGVDPKQAHWVSKRIMTNTPVSFSTAQVDAEGYEGLTLDVSHASSPHKPVKHEEYLISSSNSRRLRACRPEKLFEFSVKSTTPINFMSFSTSVTGLLGGS